MCEILSCHVGLSHWWSRGSIRIITLLLRNSYQDDQARSQGMSGCDASPLICLKVHFSPPNESKIVFCRMVKGVRFKYSTFWVQKLRSTLRESRISLKSILTTDRQDEYEESQLAKTMFTSSFECFFPYGCQTTAQFTFVKATDCVFDAG